MFVRRFRIWIVVGLVCVASIVLAGTWIPDQLSAQSQANQQVFTGIDDKGDFQTALHDARTKALQAAGCCDMRVDYRVIDVQGQFGGFAATNQVKVTILASW